MLEAVRTRSSTGLAVVALWVAAYVVARLALPHAMELDEAEQIFFSQWLRLGYGPQPPLFNWLQQGIFLLTGGPSLAGIVVLKAILLFGCFAFMLGAARQVSAQQIHQSALLIGLMLLPQVVYMPLQDLTHTVLLLAATALFYYALLRVLERPSLARYALLGLACAIGFLAKYNFALLPVAAVIAALPDASLRQRVLDKRIIVTIVIGALLVAPHLAWLATHLDAATEGTLSKMGALSDNRSALAKAASGLGSLVGAMAAFAALLLIVFALCFRSRLRDIARSHDRMTGFLGRILIVVTLALVVVILGTKATNIHERWLDPFYLVLPLYLVAKLRVASIGEAGNVRAYRAFTLTGLILLPVAIAILIARVVAAPVIGDYTKVNIPFAAFADEVRARGLQPSAILAPNWHYAGNLKLQRPAKPVLSAAQPNFTLPFAVTAEHPLLAVWPSRAGASTPMPGSMVAWLKGRDDLVIAEEDTVSRPYTLGKSGDLYSFSYAVIAPKSSR
ncbi:glycosyltransferase family 39 protein [Rhizobium halophytocola]|uniref:4-amino-4-deoxy-L-arabinose transferase-like glycosyltransferase n=1 Tax=Rhizobium halophytocola TaxID=735519 RepID=A0ABS4E3A9_9HYPH|nr:glycosyltransferase family 39 protein [Rhizobium halophytocola]MBP1852434.1 4-amino-4-deoxy-L-arabinose transferase-like glycosyltransferase [Rhizobium halophytocola]